MLSQSFTVQNLAVFFFLLEHPHTAVVIVSCHQHNKESMT